MKPKLVSRKKVKDNDRNNLKEWSEIILGSHPSMIHKGFQVHVEIEPHIENKRNLILCIKSNENAHTSGLAPMNKLELAEVAKEIINFLTRGE